MRHLPASLLAELPFNKLKMSGCLLQLEPLYKDTLACKESLGSGETPSPLTSRSPAQNQPTLGPISRSQQHPPRRAFL